LGGRHLSNWIDRKFFRDDYRAEQILARLAESLRSVLDLRSLLETVRERVSEALHVTDLEIYLRGRETFEPAPKQILSEIFFGADAFAAGEPQHDDDGVFFLFFRIGHCQGLTGLLLYRS